MALNLYEQNFKTVNLNKIKYLTMVRISELLIEQGAIIFGGFIRDKLIHDHYANIFYERNRDDDKYDDISYDHETKHRLLVPKDIDVFIRGTKEQVNEIYSFIRTKGFNVVIKRYGKIYGSFDNINQQKIVISNDSILGLPVVKIDVDVLFSSDCEVKPPFKRLDLWCNSLLMSKDGITISNQTGTRADEWDIFSRKIFEIEILSDLLNFKTCKVDLVNEKTDEQSIKNKKIITNRIESMKDRGWEIKEKI
jgi:hypothetical protein